MYLLRPLFGFDHPLSRLQFLIYTILCNAVGFMIGATSVFFQLPYALVPLALAGLFLLWTNLALTASRLLDMDFSLLHLGWITVIYLMPTVWVNFVERDWLAGAFAIIANLVSFWLMVSPTGCVTPPAKAPAVSVPAFSVNDSEHTS